MSDHPIVHHGHQITEERVVGSVQTEYVFGTVILYQRSKEEVENDPFLDPRKPADWQQRVQLEARHFDRDTALQNIRHMIDECANE